MDDLNSAATKDLPKLAYDAQNRWTSFVERLWNESGVAHFLAESVKTTTRTHRDDFMTSSTQFLGHIEDDDFGSTGSVGLEHQCDCLWRGLRNHSLSYGIAFRWLPVAFRCSAGFLTGKIVWPVV